MKNLITLFMLYIFSMMGLMYAQSSVQVNGMNADKTAMRIQQDSSSISRQPLTVTITQATWTDEVDNDGDGYTRTRKLRVWISSTENTVASFKIWKRVDGGNNSVYWNTNSSGTFISQGIYIYELPGIGTSSTGGELSHNYYDFTVHLNAWPSGDLLSVLTYSQESDLNDQRFETANEDQIAALPDLVVQNISVSSTQVQAGETISASCTVRNIGAGGATSSRVGYYLASNCNNVMEYLGDDAVSSLDPNQGSNENETLTIPANTTPGVYYLVFVADYENSVPESDENNNKTCGDAFFNVVSPTPGITVDPSSLDFGNVVVGSCSSPQSYIISGSNLTSPIEIHSPTGFEISSNGLTGWGNYLSYSSPSGDVSATVYSRFCPENVQGYNGNITHTSSGATQKNVSVSGNGTEVPPNSPSNLNATTHSSTQINLSWTDNSSSETGFKIERKTGSGGAWNEIAQVGDNTTTYSDNNLTPDTQYCYQVRAYNTAGNSNYSNESCATTSDVPPNPPTNLSTTAHSSTQINLSWTDNSNNETGFKIERKTGSGGAWNEIAQVGDNTTTYSDNNLTPDTQYCYLVRAYNSVGNSDYSNEACATTFDVPPIPPTNLSATAQSSTQINLSWTDNADNETGFKIERKTGSNGTWNDMDSVGANTTTYSDNNLTANTEYCYRVRTYNSVGNSNYTNESCATTYDVPPIPPTNLSATAQSSTQINLSWTDNSSNETGFKIERKTGSSGNWSEIAQVGADTTTFSDNNLTTNTQLCFRVRAFNSVGYSDYSNENCVIISSVKDLEMISGVPEKHLLSQNYPNPFNPTSTIVFGLAEESNVHLKVYDMLGNEVMSLLSGETLPAGYYQYSLNAENLSSGIYLYSVTVVSSNGLAFRDTKKMLLIK